MFHKKKKKAIYHQRAFHIQGSSAVLHTKIHALVETVFFFFKINVKSIIFNEAQFKIHTKYSFFFNPNQIQEPRFPIYSQYTSKVVTMMLFFFPPKN